MTSSTVCQLPCGMVPPCSARRTAKVNLSIQQEVSSAWIFRGWTVAPLPLTTPIISAQDAESWLMGLRAVLECKRLDPLLPRSLRLGANTSMQLAYRINTQAFQMVFDSVLMQTFSPYPRSLPPLDHPSIAEHITEFNSIIQTEF